MRGKLHLPVFQHYLYQTAMEPLLESSSLQIGPSSSKMVAQDYELIVISGNCERRMLQRTWWTCVLRKKALVLIEVWIFHQAIWPGWLKSWRAQIQEGKSGRTEKGTICYSYETGRVPARNHLIFYLQFYWQTCNFRLINPINTKNINWYSLPYWYNTSEEMLPKTFLKYITYKQQ